MVRGGRRGPPVGHGVGHRRVVGNRISPRRLRGPVATAGGRHARHAGRGDRVPPLDARIPSRRERGGRGGRCSPHRSPRGVFPHRPPTGSTSPPPPQTPPPPAPRRAGG